MVYDYSQLGFFTKHTQEVFWVCLGIIAVAAVIGIIISFCKEGFFGKLFSLIITAAICVGLYYGAAYLRDYNISANESYLHYKQMEENGEVKVVSGTVEKYAKYSKHREFTLGGVEFKIYSNSERNGPERYYKYSNASSYYDATNHNTVYIQESCIITGDNQKLEIHYVFEEGENRILYVKELSE